MEHDHTRKDFWPIFIFNKARLMASPFIELVNETLLLMGSALILRLRMNIGVGEEDGHLRVLAEKFEGGSRTRRTTRMQEDGWLVFLGLPFNNHFA